MEERLEDKRTCSLNPIIKMTQKCGSASKILSYSNIGQIQLEFLIRNDSGRVDQLLT